MEEVDDLLGFDTARSQPTKRNRKDKKYRASLLDEAILKNREKGERLMGLDNKRKLNRCTTHRLSTSMESTDLVETRIPKLKR